MFWYPFLVPFFGTISRVFCFSRFVFWQIYKFPKIEIFVKNRNYGKKLKIIVKNQNYGQKLKVLSKTEIMVKNFC